MQLEARVLHAVQAACGEGVIGVAVSGGSDSLALLDVAQRALAGRVAAVTLDHGLRAEAAAEAAMVAAFCAERGMSHTTLKWQGWDGQGNLQAAARAARYRLIADWALARGIGCVALGHTRDDVAETLLMRLARRAGVDGLSAMAPQFERNGVTWLRPLLGVGRAALRAHLTAQGIAWADDPSNTDDSYDRVKARQALDALAPLGIDAEGLAYSAQAAAEARAALQHYTRVEAQRYVVEDRGDLLLTIPDDLPAEIARRLVSAGLHWIGGGAYAPRHEAVRAVLLGDTQTAAGCFVTREGDRLRITRELNAVQGVAVDVGALWDGRWMVTGPGRDCEVRALGEALTDCPDWRDTGLPRRSLMASPAVWRENQFIAAPLAGFGPGWSARIAAPFTKFLDSR